MGVGYWFRVALASGLFCGGGWAGPGGTDGAVCAAEWTTPPFVCIPRQGWAVLNWTLDVAVGHGTLAVVAMDMTALNAVGSVK